MTKTSTTAESIRCPGCLNWITHFGALAVFVPQNGGGKAVPYALCRQCARQLNGNKATQQALTNRIESYLMGGATK